MQDLMLEGDAPIGSKVPAPIDSKTMWELDVDNELWTEIFQDDQFQDKDAPKWLCDGPTKKGIRALLELRRCDEELERLTHERGVMYAWLQGQREQLKHAGSIAQGE